MASTFLHSISISPLNYHFLALTSSNPPFLLLQGSQKLYQQPFSSSIQCTSSTDLPQPQPQLQLQPQSVEPADDDPSFPLPKTNTLNDPETFPIERRRRSTIVRERRPGLVKPEPQNYQVGWKRTKVINTEEPIGYEVMDFLDKLVGLMEGQFGSTELLAKAGEIVAERAREEAEVLFDEGKVEERMVTELFRVLRLMEMDLAMVKAAVKEDTIQERLEQAKARCRQAILVAKSF